ncbi:MAG: DUF202 domain-containing protein [Pseudonocardiaceae bacterium]|nr:DUF202 domain-containing protein [Pseudonocardiaceae bacterium]
MSDNQPGARMRWPRRVYGVGAEPDPRFTLANERTFLAWLRTGLALMAGGVGVQALIPGGELEKALAVGLLALGIVCSTGAFVRWAATERAMRLGRPLPPLRLAAVFGIGLALAGVVALVVAVRA